MSKFFKEALRRMKRTYYLFWLVVIAVVGLGEFGMVFTGLFTENGVVVYVLETLVILTTGLSIPLSLKLFSKKINQITADDAVEYAVDLYHKWFVIRQLILGLAIMFAIITHYLCLSSTGALCALLIGFTSLFCIPSEKKLLFAVEPILNKEKTE